jgi:hypothetical protein
MSKFLSRAALGAALLAVSGFAMAASSTVIVDSVANSVGDGTGLSTGVFLTAGESFSVSVPTDEIWNNSGGDPTYDSNADGHTFQMGDLVGLYDAIGSLVGEIGNGAFFHVGTDFTGLANASGELKFFYFDSDAWNNIGSVDATISAVPEPANLMLMGLALGAFALSRRRKA